MSLPAAIAQALAPFAPPASTIHQDAQEAQAIRADLAYNDLKNTGELRRREDERALADQIKWSTP